MGKANPRKKLWVEAAKHFISYELSFYSLSIAQKATEDVLDFFAAKARERKTARDRNKVWYEELRDYCIEQMLRQDITERKAAHGSTHYMLVPTLTMGKDKAGLAKFDRLVDLVGVVEAYKLVNVTVYQIPAHEVEVSVRDPRFEKGKEQTKTESIGAYSETEFTFVGTGSTRELLFWTVALGNKPSFEVGLAPKRVKEGKQRRKR